jgi:penicillin-binding protein 1A
MSKKGKTSILSLPWRGVKKVVNWYIGIFKGRPWYIKIVSTIASLLVIFVLYLVAVDVNFLWLFGKSPSM